MRRIVHFAYVDTEGGSGRSAYRLHQGLNRSGYDSRMLVAQKSSTDPQVGVIGGQLSKFADRVALKLNAWLGGQDLYIPSSRLIHRHPWIKKADLVQIFNTWGGYLSFTALPRLSQDRPVVWRLSDQWLFTGHCVYDHGCPRWQTGCGQCPQVSGERALRWDTSAYLWRVKQRVYQHSRLVIVAPSRWMLDLAQQSPLIGHFPIHHIPNGVDTQTYAPQPKAAVRARFGIPPDAQVILFASHQLGAGRKGGHLLNEALLHLPDLPQPYLLLLGENTTHPLEKVGAWTVRYAGYLREEADLAAAYNAADIMALPTLADNLPNTALESLACGVPVVAFKVGGVVDAVRHGETGYLAAPQDVANLAEGFRLLLFDPTRYRQLSQRCRAIAEAEYTQERELNAFLALYNTL
jgi:glycosyltransferase involved in cell wall biosynthesis